LLGPLAVSIRVCDSFYKHDPAIHVNLLACEPRRGVKYLLDAIGNQVVSIKRFNLDLRSHAGFLVVFAYRSFYKSCVGTRLSNHLLVLEQLVREQIEREQFLRIKDERAKNNG